MGSSEQMMGLGNTNGVGAFLTVTSDCVLYHAYWNRDLKDHSIYGNDGTLVSDGGGTASFGSLGLTLTPIIDVFYKGYFVNVPTNTGLTPTGTFTLETFVNNTTNTRDDSPIIYQGSNDGTSVAVSTSIESDGNGIQWINSSTATGSSSSIAFDAWYGIAITFNRSTDLFVCYINGASDSSNPGFGEDASLDNTKLFIGKSFSPELLSYFYGTIGEVRLWKTVLSGATIASNFNATKARYGL